MTDCPYDNKDCNEEDPATLCDGCKEDRARDHAQSRYDTYD